MTKTKRGEDKINLGSFHMATEYGFTHSGWDALSNLKDIDITDSENSV